MKYLSKICDAADWFDDEFNQVVREELVENARFHRKQWEFAMIFLTLKKYGMLKDDKIGLSMGGGNERVLYSIAKYTRQLIVTDLYDSSTSWDCARTENPQELINISKPFPVDDEKIKALRMDMRDLKFDNNTFDFCYSSCAVEHIGNFDDFVNHFNEVYRCLKENGIYVFTTEFLFGKHTIKDANNYVFSPDFLTRMLGSTQLSLEINPEISLTEHEINKPMPSNIKNYFYSGENELLSKIGNYASHLILTRGKFPFTSILLILRKKSVNISDNKITYANYYKTEQNLNREVSSLEEKIINSNLSINPYSSLPEGVSPFAVDHSEFFINKNSVNATDKTIFHTDYLWLGSHERTITIQFKNPSILGNGKAEINLRIHRYPVLNSQKNECIYEKDLDIYGTNSINETVNIYTDEDYVYAILAKIKKGNILLENISISSSPVNKKLKKNLTDLQPI